MANKKKAAKSTQGANDLKNLPPDRRSAQSLRRGKRWLAASLLLIPTIIGITIAIALTAVMPAIIGILLGALLYSNTHVVLEWESAIVLRFGRFHHVQESGMFFTIPLIDFIGAYVDRRLIATTFKAERTLTADSVPVNVDAVLFWMVWDAKSACTEVHNYRDAVYWAAQTALRDAIGSISIAELSTRRKALDEEIKQALVAKTENWGVTITSVEMRDIVIPEALQDALSKEAQAERERSARVTLAEAEEDISEMFVRAAQNYGDEGSALHLRAMNMLYDGVKEHGGLVLVPNSLADSFSRAAMATTSEAPVENAAEGAGRSAR